MQHLVDEGTRAYEAKSLSTGRAGGKVACRKGSFLGNARTHVGVEVGEGLVARFGDALVLVADVGQYRETAEELLEAVETAASGTVPAGPVIAARLAAIVANGEPGTVPSFGIVAPLDDGYLVLLHGLVSAEITGAPGVLRLSGEQAVTWVDQRVQVPVDRLSVTCREHPVKVDPMSDLRAGLVPGSGFVLTPEGGSGSRQVAGSARVGTHTTKTSEAPGGRDETTSPAQSTGGDAGASATSAPGAGATEARAPERRTAVRRTAEIKPGESMGAETSGAETESAETRRADPKSGAPKTGPADCEPRAAEPLAAVALEAELAPAEPLATEPLAAEPLTAEPLTAEPLAAEPAPTEASAAEPLVAEPAPEEPGAATAAAAADEPRPTTGSQAETAPAAAAVAVDAGRLAAAHESTEGGLAETAPPPAARSTEALVAPVGHLVSTDGVRIPLDRDYVLGREPEADPAVRSGAATPVRLADEENLISRVHSYIDVEEGEVSLRDASSANGTYVAAPGDEAWARLGIDPVVLTPTWSLRVGNRVFTYVTTDAP